MRIILADPPRKEKLYHINYPNMGIIYLIGYLRQKFGNRAEIKYLEGHISLKDHVEEVKRFSPDIYGISFVSFLKDIAYKTVRAVREIYPYMKIICGGVHPTISPDNVLNKSGADYCVIGEGEETFYELCKRIREGGNNIEEVDGICFFENGNFVRTKKRAFITDLDTIPFPSWDLINFKQYPGMHIRKRTPQAYLVAARGCPFDCVFCSNPIWKSNKPWVRLRTPQNICEEIKYLYKNGVREIYFSADEFNPVLNWPIETCEAIKSLKLKDLYFQCNLRVDKINEDLVHSLKGAGIWLIHLGIESFNQRVLDGIEKKITIEQVMNALQIFKKFAMKVYANLMIFNVWEQNGELCNESLDEVEDSYRVTKKLYSEGFFHYMTWQLTTPQPGSRLYKIAKKYDLLTTQEEDFDVRKHNIKIPGVSRRQIYNMQRKGMLMKNLYALKSGGVQWRHWDRVWENIQALFRF